MMVWRPAALWICASLAVIAMLVVAPWTALGGGDEEPAPPSVGPPGPWSEREVGEGEDLPYRPTDAKGCRLGGTRGAGPGSVLGVWVVHTRCATAKGVVGRYQRCLNSERGRKRRCYARIDKRCVRPVFLGRCWLRDRFFRRQVDGLWLHRAAAVRGRGPLRGTRHVPQGRPADQSHATPCTPRAPSRSTPSRSCGRPGPTRA